MLETRVGTMAVVDGKIGGLAAPYGVLSHSLSVRGVNRDRPFRERIERGSFDGASSQNVSLLVGHDRRQLVANTKSGLLQLSDTARGLEYEVVLPDTQLARDTRALVESGVLSEMSFGFYVKRDSWEGSTRTLHSVDLREISIVETGAYPQTGAEARTLQRLAASLRLRLRTLPS